MNTNSTSPFSNATNVVLSSSSNQTIDLTQVSTEQLLTALNSKGINTMEAINKISIMNSNAPDSKDEFSADNVINSQDLKNSLLTRDAVNENSLTGK